MQLRNVLKNTFPKTWELLKSFRRLVLNSRSTTTVFEGIYQNNNWGNDDSKSGPGSDLARTEVIRKFLPEFLTRINAQTLLDLPCGDLFWLKSLDLNNINYIGGDVVPEIIEKNTHNFKNKNRQFLVLDVIKDTLPDANVILCRDCFIHLPNSMIKQAIENIHNSKIEYLLTTTFTEITDNIDIEIGGFRAINLQIAPFNLPDPIEIHPEGGGYGKSIAAWRIKDL